VTARVLGASNDCPSEHEFDVRERQRFAEVLKWTREAREMETVDVSAALKMREDRVAHWESCDDSWAWRISEIQKWTGVFGLRMNLDFQFLPYLPTLDEMAREDHGWVVARDQRPWNPNIEGWLALRVLRRIRKQEGIMTKDMARAMGVVPGTLHKIETSEDPRISTVQRYARALAGSVDMRILLLKKEPKPY
jgi:DNA-binding XRE family transcriptional regulator